MKIVKTLLFLILATGCHKNYGQTYMNKGLFVPYTSEALNQSAVDAKSITINFTGDRQNHYEQCTYLGKLKAIKMKKAKVVAARIGATNILFADSTVVESTIGFVTPNGGGALFPTKTAYGFYHLFKCK
jgi:hypothetical protein